MDPVQKKQRIKEESDKYFQENCVKQLESIAHKPKRLKWAWVSSMNFIQPFWRLLLINLCLADHQDHRDTLAHLVQVTEKLVRNHVQESVWIVSATAQRVNADEKVKSCIAWALCWDFSSIELTLRLSCSIGIKSTYHPSHLFSQCSYVLIRVLARPRGRHLLF